jgi:F-type H+-transporting ATPase subunit delta
MDSKQVNVSTTSGDMGILANHVPSITQLRPGIVEVIAEGAQNEKFFGFLSPN